MADNVDPAHGFRRPQNALDVELALESCARILTRRKESAILALGLRHGVEHPPWLATAAQQTLELRM